MKSVVTVVMFAVLVAACGGSPAAQPESSPAPTAPSPPPPEPERSNPEPVEIDAGIEVTEQGVLIYGTTNLPDGAVLSYDLNVFGSGCLTDDCREFEVLTEEQVSVRDGDSGSGFLTVTSGKFSIGLPEWNALPVCGWQSEAEWETWLDVLFFSDVAWADLANNDSGQPEDIYELYGRAGERLTAAAPAVEVRGLSGPFVRLEVEC